MKKIIAFLFFISAMCCAAFAQSRLREFEKAGEIKLLESNRADVKRILAGFKSDADEDESKNDEPIYSETFSNKNADIEISYSTGDCSDDSEMWNVAEGKVTEIRISPKNQVPLKNVGIDYSKFRRERIFTNLPHSYIYFDKSSGRAITVNRKKIWSIYLLPAKNSFSSVCNNETGRNYTSQKKWFVNSKLKERIHEAPNLPADVIDINLSVSEITTSCDLSDNTSNKNCADSIKQISISTLAEDAEGDILTYNYEISGGKIVGQGAKVVWDLSGVNAGTYTITAGVDDGCGVCGKTQTKTIVVKECPDCSAK